MSWPFIVILNIAILVIAVDYCDRSLCIPGQRHVACKTMASIYPQCPPNTKMIRFNITSKDILVDGHNKKRNIIAGGYDGKLEPACKMATIVWNTDLAYLASLNVLQCLMKHDQCHNTHIFKYSGQNLALLNYTGKINIGSLLTEAIELWFKEGETLPIADDQTTYSGPITNYTNLAAGRNIRLGCAASTFSMTFNENSFLLACNYASKTVSPFPIYAPCTTAGSYCATGTNPDYPNLCSLAEIYSLNTWTPIKMTLTNDADYCSKSLCKNGTKHIACGHSGIFAATCPRDAALVNINDLLKHVLMNGHNSVRNFIASGADRKHDAACKMGKMLWDDELASLAALNVRKCDLSPDKCHNTEIFKNSGQNLFWHNVMGKVDNMREIIIALKMWVSGMAASNRSYIEKYPSNGPNIHDFAVMVTDRNNRVGCAISTYTFQRAPNNAFLLACNYAASPVVNSSVYKVCKVPAEECITGKSDTHINLCSTDEIYDYEYEYE